MHDCVRLRRPRFLLNHLSRQPLHRATRAAATRERGHLAGGGGSPGVASHLVRFPRHQDPIGCPPARFIASPDGGLGRPSEASSMTLLLRLHFVATSCAFRVNDDLPLFTEPSYPRQLSSRPLHNGSRTVRLERPCKTRPARSHQGAAAPQKWRRSEVGDVIFGGIALVFFGLCLLYVRAADKL